ncbi:hypothetical protein OKW49_002756 [Paraburkholderia youngii]
MGLRYITISKFSEESGFSEDAIRTKISRGVWLEGEVWRWAGGRQLIDVEGYERWVETGGVLGRFHGAVSKSHLPTGG